MLYRETITVCSEIHAKQNYTVGRTHFLNVTAGGTYSDHCALQD